jgi:hypothetical protein
MKKEILTILLFTLAYNVYSQVEFSVDTAYHPPLVVKDSTGYRMLITIQHKKHCKIDTIYNNLRPPFNPVALHFVKQVGDKIVMLTESEFMITYRVYKLNPSRRWELKNSKSLGTKSRFFSTTVEAIDCLNIKVRNGNGDFLWQFEPLLEKFIQTEIIVEKH